jgi:hypothetical protein
VGIPFLRIQIDRFNPNHKYRFYAISLHAQFYWLFTLRFSNKDKSIYIAPLVTNNCLLKVLDGNSQGEYKCYPNERSHLSLHESGVVNYKTPRDDLRLRGAMEKRQPTQKMFTLAINRYDHLQPAKIIEINKSKGGYIYLPIIGIIFQNPVFLTVYRVEATSQWSTPALGNTFQLHYETYFKNKDFVFHFLIWQDTRIKSQEGDIAISWH